MNCPDLSALARVGTPRADPAVVAHLKTCESCWLDWQIQQGARYLLDPEIMVPESDDLNERVIARITAIARHSERPASWRRLAVSGLLVASAAMAFLWVTMDATNPIPITNAAFYALAGGVAAALYLRRQDEKECANR